MCLERQLPLAPPLVALLSDVVSMTPQVLLDSFPQLREAFSYLSVLPPTSALDLLDAILVSMSWPVVVRNPPLSLSFNHSPLSSSVLL